MSGGFETLEINRRYSLSLALFSLADAAIANAMTPLSALPETKKKGQRTFGATGRQMMQNSSPE